MGARLLKRGSVVFLMVILCVVWLIPKPAQAQTPLKVVATFSILGDLVHNVGGPHIALSVIVPTGSDAHTFEPSPADNVTLSEAALVFEIGAEFEPWLDDMYRASGSTAQRVVATEGLQLMELGQEHEDEHEAAATHEAEHEGEHEHGEFDPHVWHDVARAKQMVESIRDALAQADANNAEAYRTSADAYLKQLDDLDAFVKAEIDKLPAERRKLFTTHDTFAYFGERYGFAVNSALGITTEAADPSPAQLGALIDEIKAAGVPAIFADNVTNPQLMEQIAREAGVKLGPKLYTDALGELNSEGATYLELMRYNVTVIVRALGE